MTLGRSIRGPRAILGISPISVDYDAGPIWVRYNKAAGGDSLLGTGRGLPSVFGINDSHYGKLYDPEAKNSSSPTFRLTLTRQERRNEAISLPWSYGTARDTEDHSSSPRAFVFGTVRVT